METLVACLLIVVGSLLAFTIYFFPCVVGSARGHKNIGSIFVLNLFLGWTFLGWVVALAMAMSGNAEIVKQSEV